jgi:hypothetical protein
VKVTGEMIDVFEGAALCQCHPEDETGTRLQAVLDLIERHGFIAEVEGDEVRVIATRTYRSSELARALRDGLSIGFTAQVEWRPVPAERSVE